MEIKEELLQLIFSVAKIGRLRLNRQLRKEGLTFPQLLVMKNVYLRTQIEDKRASPAELSDLTGISRSTMTGIIDRLERDGLVERKKCSDDRRSQNIIFTKNGSALMENLNEMMDKIRREPLQALSAEQLLVLRGYLIQIETYLNETNE